MNLKSRSRSPGLALLCCAMAAAASTLGGCHKTPTVADEPATATTTDEATGVSLKPEEIEKLGIATTVAKTTTHAPEAGGFAMVLSHENIATAVAELDTAAATERQSRSALARTKRLQGTAGAMPADILEGAERQAAVDRVALELARRKLSSMLGQNSPWKNQNESPQLRALARGDAKLVRVSFPLTAGVDVTPHSLRLAHINASQGGKSVETSSVWGAPSDAGVPGRSYFAYLKSSDFGEGEHLLAWMALGEPEAGVLVPLAAVVINGGKYWCYVEEKPGLFVRAPLDPNSTINDGYFVKEGIESGAKIVTAAAGLLLAREINPSTAPAD